MPTIKQIIKNQEDYKNEILFFLIEEIKLARKELKNIESEDEFIKKEKEKLLRKFKKNNTLESIKKYFFLSKKRDENYYIWWNNSTQEALINRYDQN